MPEKEYVVETSSGGMIVLYHLAGKKSQGHPVIVAHGSVSNADSVRDVGACLNDHGFDCWLLEWGGHGKSEAVSARQNFEQAAFHDVPAAIDFVLAQTGRSCCHWVSHSGGGHLILMYLCRYLNRQSTVAGCVVMGAQATDFALTFKSAISAMILWLITLVCGRTPASLLKMATEPEPTMLLVQWAQWNLRKRWVGTDGFDYMAALKKVTVPALVIAGGNDQVAPISGCKKIYEAMGSHLKAWVACATEHGFSKDFSHGQLVRGGAAREEVYPHILAFLSKLCDKN